MKIPDTPFQVLHAPSHVTNTPSQCRRHQIRQPKQQVHQPKQQVRPISIAANLRTFPAYNLQAKKCGGVQKMTNIRYECNHINRVTEKVGTRVLSHYWSVSQVVCLKIVRKLCLWISIEGFLFRQVGSISAATCFPFSKGGCEIGKNDSRIFKRDTFMNFSI